MDDKNVNSKDDYKEGYNNIDLSDVKGKYSSVILEGNKQEDTYYTDELLHDKNKAEELLQKYEGLEDHELLEKALEYDMQGKLDSINSGHNNGDEMKTHQLIYELLATYIIRNNNPRIITRTKGYAECKDAYSKDNDEEINRTR